MIYKGVKGKKKKTCSRMNANFSSAVIEIIPEKEKIVSCMFGCEVSPENGILLSLGKFKPELSREVNFIGLFRTALAWGIQCK